MARRVSSGMVVPLLLAVAGVALIIVGQLGLDQPPVASLPPIPDPSSPVAVASPSAVPSPSATRLETPGPTATQPASPSPTAIPADWVATQIQVEAVGLNVAVRQGRAPNCTYPLGDAAYIDCNATQPGRGTNSYITGHAVVPIFKRLWNVRLGDEVKVLMSDGAVLRYVVSEVRPNVSCPDANPPNPQLNPEALGVELPLALRYPPPGPCPGAEWLEATDHELLTLQTSQGYNRNWGELIIIADPLD